MGSRSQRDFCEGSAKTNSDEPANHIPTIYRDPTNDYGQQFSGTITLRTAHHRDTERTAEKEHSTIKRAIILTWAFRSSSALWSFLYREDV
jgi:hypothetical protein